MSNKIYMFKFYENKVKRHATKYSLNAYMLLDTNFLTF